MIKKELCLCELNLFYIKYMKYIWMYMEKSYFILKLLIIADFMNCLKRARVDGLGDVRFETDMKILVCEVKTRRIVPFQVIAAGYIKFISN